MSSFIMATVPYILQNKVLLHPSKQFLLMPDILRTVGYTNYDFFLEIWRIQD
jgi:hypothetical protein